MGEETSQSADAPGVRVLIVEDDDGDALLVQTALRRVDPRIQTAIVTTTEGGEEAICSGAYDAAIVDYRLGASDGMTLIATCRERGSNMPLILLTGQGGAQIDREALKRGASDYLNKDRLDPGRLERAVRYAIERHRAEAELLVERRRYAAAVAGSHDGIWEWNVGTNELYLSPRFKNILGLADAAMPNTLDAARARLHPEDYARVRQAVIAHLDGRSSTLATEHRMRHRDGSWVWVYLRGLAQRSSDGTPERLAGSLSDITARKRAEEETRHRALHDPLTGLANRALLFDRLELSIQHTAREAGYGFSTLCLDLDGFKPINDNYGHSAGDAVLTEVGRRLQRNARAVDCVARVGGDEFVLLVDGCRETAAAREVARQLEDAVAAPIEVQGVPVCLRTSIGVRVVVTGSVTAADVIRDADQAMYLAKMARRREPGSARASMAEDEDQARFEADLRAAIEGAEIRPHYQPIVDARSGVPIGYEALARWTHPTRGPVSPLSFVPVAERAGWIRDLGCLMLRRGCSWARETDRPSVSVNVSPSHVASPQFADDVEQILALTGLAPDRLRLEITEHVSLVESAAVSSALDRLAERGIAIDLDDFGTGYSAMDMLLRLPLSAVKLDRSLVAGADTDRRKQRMIRLVVEMAHAFDASITAEGVETEGEWAIARELGVDRLQGYYFARPAPPEEIAPIASLASVG